MASSRSQPPSTSTRPAHRGPSASGRHRGDDRPEPVARDDDRPAGRQPGSLGHGDRVGARASRGRSPSIGASERPWPRRSGDDRGGRRREPPRDGCPRPGRLEEPGQQQDAGPVTADPAAEGPPQSWKWSRTSPSARTTNPSGSASGSGAGATRVVGAHGTIASTRSAGGSGVAVIAARIRARWRSAGAAPDRRRRVRAPRATSGSSTWSTARSPGIPQPFRAELDDVAIVIADDPSPEQLRENEPRGRRDALRAVRGRAAIRVGRRLGPDADADPALPAAARGGLPASGRPGGRGPDHDPPRARPPPGHRGRGPPRRSSGSTRASGSGAAIASSSPSRSTATLPPDRITQTRSPSRIGIAPVRTAASAAEPAGSRTCFDPLDREPQAREDRRVVDQDDVLDVAPDIVERYRPAERRAEPVGDAHRRDAHGLPGLEAAGHRLGPDRLDAVDAHRRACAP